MIKNKYLIFSKTGYEPFFDFLKGICIILVILNHSLSGDIKENTLFVLWGYPAVPIFLLIQVFHTYKNGYKNQKFRFYKSWKRVILPFAIAETITIGSLLLLHKEHASNIINTFYYCGGYGPGSYYPWIYLQFAIILPLLAPVISKLNENWIIPFFLFLAIGTEFFSSLVHLPQWLWRLLLLKYLFIIFLGYIIVERGIRLNLITIFLSLISIFTTLYLGYYDIDLSPWFYYMPNWNPVHWINYIYIIYFMIYFYKRVFESIKANNTINSFICIIGKQSYSIFVFQLFFFSVIAPYISSLLITFYPPNLSNYIFAILTLSICISWGFIMQKTEERLKVIKRRNR